MKFRISSTAKASYVGNNEQLVSKIMPVSEILEFDHEPTDEEIQRAFEKLPTYSKYILQWKELFRKELLE